MAKAKILIVDDDPDLVEATRVMLEAKGYAVLSAHDYSDGFAKIQEAKPDLIILDAMLMLNDRTGLQLPSAVRKDPAIARIPILMITAINDGNTGEEFAPGTENRELPIDGFLNKPARPEELYRQVDALLKMKSSKWAAKFSA